MVSTTGPACVPTAGRQRGRRTGARGLGCGWVQCTVWLSIVNLYSKYSESGGHICNPLYSLLFSSGIPLKIVPLKRRFVQTATTYINQRNTGYRCLWVAPSKDNSSKEKIFFHYLTSYLWSTRCQWSQQTLVNTVIIARLLNQRYTHRLLKRTAWIPLGSPPNCLQWRAPAFRNDADYTHGFKEMLQNIAGG